MANILVISLDFDSCTDTKAARSWLMTWLIDYLLEHEEITDVEFHLNTARKTVWEDYRMSRQYVKFHRGLFSCSQLERSFMPWFQENLESAFAEAGKEAPKVRFERLVLGDVLNQLHSGTMLDHMQESRYQQWSLAKTQGEHTVLTVPGQHSQGVVLYDSEELYDAYAEKTYVDTSKFLTMYMHLQNIANRSQLGGNTYHIKMLDDRPDILHEVQERFSGAPQLLPEHCTLQTIHCCIDKGPRHAIPKPLSEVAIQNDVIHGTAAANPDYAEDIRAVVKAMQAVPKQGSYPNPSAIFQCLLRHLTSKEPGLSFLRAHPLVDVFWGENDSDIGDEEMLQSAFGQGSYSVRKRLGMS